MSVITMELHRDWQAFDTSTGQPKTTIIPGGTHEVERIFGLAMNEPGPWLVLKGTKIGKPEYQWRDFVFPRNGFGYQIIIREEYEGQHPFLMWCLQQSKGTLNEHWLELMLGLYLHGGQINIVVETNPPTQERILWGLVQDMPENTTPRKIFLDQLVEKQGNSWVASKRNGHIFQSAHDYRVVLADTTNKLVLKHEREKETITLIPKGHPDRFTMKK